MSTEEIKLALKMGKTICWKCSSYVVSFRAKTDELFILCKLNHHMIGVGKYHKSEDFYIGNPSSIRFDDFCAWNKARNKALQAKEVVS